jgi:hypothetical protein
LRYAEALERNRSDSSILYGGQAFLDCASACWERRNTPEAPAEFTVGKEDEITPPVYLLVIT